MFKGLLSSKLKIVNALKICIFIIAILLVFGFVMGISQVYSTKSEKNDMQKINDMLTINGVNDEIKGEINTFIKKYPSTQNIVITDDKSNIVYSANKQYIDNLKNFILDTNKRDNGVSNLKGTNTYFITNSKSFMMRVPFKNNSLFIRRNPMNNDAPVDIQSINRNAFRGMDLQKDMHLKNPVFLKGFNISGKGLNIYYISRQFNENILNKIFFISSILLRVVILIFWVLLAVWVYRDSKQRGFMAVFWGILAILTGLVGLLIYLLYRQSHQYCPSCEKKVCKDDNYCYECGYALKNKCPQCEKMLDLNANYCSNCGKSIEVDIEENKD